MRINVYKWILIDILRKKCSSVGAFSLYMAYRFVRPFNQKVGLTLLMMAARLCPMQQYDNAISIEKNLIKKIADQMLKPTADYEVKHVYSRSIVLKNPIIRDNEIEKGVFLIKFTTLFPYFVQQVDIEELMKYFYVVLEPSWSGYSIPEILSWIKYDSPVIIESSEIKDYNLLKTLDENLVPVRFGSSDWVDFSRFYPIEDIEKKFDSIYVANYHPMKRHHAYFKAIADISDPSYYVALVCNSWGGGGDVVNQLIDYYGIKNNIEFFERQPQYEVNRLFNQSKVNVLMSLKEGSNRTIFEGFFAGVPGIVLKQNIGVNKDYINEHTGKLVSEYELPKTLLYFRENWLKYKPRDWAMDNISPKCTTRKLEELTISMAKEEGMLLTSQFAVKVNVPEVSYLEASDARKMLTSQQVVDLFKNKGQPSNRYLEELKAFLQDLDG